MEEGIKFPTLKLFHSPVYKQILESQVKAKINERSSRKNVSEFDLFMNNFQRLKDYDQMRHQILVLSKRYFASIQKKIPIGSPFPILGFKCFTSIEDKYPKLVQDQQMLGEFKKYLRKIHQILRQKQMQHELTIQKDLITLKNQIMFYYYQIVLHSCFKIYSEKKKANNKSLQDFFKETITNFYKGVKQQCKELQDTDEFFNSNLMKLKFGIFHFHQMKSRGINEGLIKKLTEIAICFQNLFVKKNDDQYLEESQVKPDHFNSSINQVFGAFIYIINQADNPQRLNQIPLRLFQIFSNLNYDLDLISKQKRIELDCLNKILAQFGVYTSKLIINPNNFHRLSSQVYRKILELISQFQNRQNKIDGPSERKLIYNFKIRIQQIYCINFFEPWNYITDTMYQKDNTVEQQYLPLMLRQIISFLLLINFRKSVEQLGDNNQYETITLLKNQFNQMLNILLYYYQLQRDNFFLQFQAKILLLEVYLLLQIPCKYYIRIYQDCHSVFYGLVSIKNHLVNLRNQFFKLKKLQVRSNRISINEDMTTDNEILYKINSEDKNLPSTQEQQETAIFQDLMQKPERRYSVQLAVRETGILFRFTEIKCMKEFLIKVSLKCKLNSFQNQEILIIQPNSPRKAEKESIKKVSKENQKEANSPIKHKQKAKLNMKYVFKKEIEDDERRIFLNPMKVAYNEDQADLSYNRISNLLYTIYASNMNSLNFHQKSISQPMKQLLQDYLAGQQQQVKKIIIDVEMKLFLGRYDEILNILHVNTIMTQIDQRSFPIFSAVSDIIQRVRQNQEQGKLQRILLGYQQYQYKALIKFMVYCQSVKQQKQKGLIARGMAQNIFRDEHYSWSIYQIQKLANLDDQLKNNMTVEWLQDSEQQGKLKKDTFRIHIDLSSFGNDFQMKFKALKQLLKPYTNIQKKGICRLSTLNKVNRQIILTIDVNPISVDTFLQQPNCNFYSQLWSTLINRKQHYEELMSTSRQDHDLYDEKALMKLHEVSQYLIRKTVSNIIFLTSENPDYQISSDDYIYQTRMDFCHSISINPFFKIINTLFASSNQIINPQRNQSLKKFHCDYPFARNILNSRLLSLMMVNPNHNIENLFDEQYKDYMCLCSQSFWNQYLCSISYIIMQNNLQDKYFYEKLPLFQFPLQKISMIKSSFESMRRGSYDKQIKQEQGLQHSRKNSRARQNLNHQLIPKLVQLKLALHGQQFNPKAKSDSIIGSKGEEDYRFIGIIHYQACSIFNIKFKYSMTCQKTVYLMWERHQTTKMEYTFVQRVAQPEKLRCHNFFHFMRCVRNALSHKTFEDIIQNNRIRAEQILMIQKLRIITTNYPFLLTFLFQKYDDLSAFSIEEVFKNRLNKCNQLLQIIKELKEDGSDEAFHKDANLISYFNYLIKEIKNSLDHGSSFNSQTQKRQPKYACGNKCVGQSIVDILIQPIQNIIKSLGEFGRITLPSDCLNIQCNELKKRRIRNNGIIQTIAHLLNYFEYLLRQQANRILCSWVKKSSR